MNKTAIFLAVVSIIGFVVSNNLTSHGGDVEDMIGSFLLLGSWGKSLKVTMPAGLDFPKTAKDWEEVYKKWEKELKFNQEDFINGQTLNSHPRTFKPADRPTGDATLS